MLIVGLGARISKPKPKPNQRDDTPSQTGSEGNVPVGLDDGIDVNVIIDEADQVAEQLAAEQLAADEQAADELAADEEAAADEMAAEQQAAADEMAAEQQAAADEQAAEQQAAMERESPVAQEHRHVIAWLRTMPIGERRQAIQGQYDFDVEEELLYYASTPRGTQGGGAGWSKPSATIAPSIPTSNRAAKKVFRTPELRGEILQYMLPTQEQLAERGSRAERGGRRYLLNLGFTPQEVDEIYEASTGRGVGSSREAAIAPTIPPPPTDDVLLNDDDVVFEEVDFELSLQDMRRELEEMKRKEGRFLNSASTNRKLRSDIQRLKTIIEERERRERDDEDAALTRFL
jgi:hypothetical protein